MAKKIKPGDLIVIVVALLLVLWFFQAFFSEHTKTLDKEKVLSAFSTTIPRFVEARRQAVESMPVLHKYLSDFKKSNFFFNRERTEHPSPSPTPETKLTALESLEFQRLFKGVAYIRGKILPLTFCDSHVGYEHFDAVIEWGLRSKLPQDLLAETPAEVGTIVCVDWTAKSIGTWSDGGTVITESCVVYILDLKTKDIVGIKEFTGLKPLDNVPANLDRLPPRRYGDIASYISALQRLQ